jgi:hypothetical protein
MDIFGEVGVDGAGSDWEFTDAVFKRREQVFAPTTTWDESEWISFVGGDAWSRSSGLSRPPIPRSDRLVLGQSSPLDGLRTHDPSQRSMTPCRTALVDVISDDGPYTAATSSRDPNSTLIGAP